MAYSDYNYQILNKQTGELIKKSHFPNLLEKTTCIERAKSEIRKYGVSLCYAVIVAFTFKRGYHITDVINK